MDREEVIKWLKIMKANLNTFPEINCGKKIEALAEAIRLLKNERSEEPSSSEKPNKSEIPTGSITNNDLGVDCIDRDSAIKALDYDIKCFEFKSGVSKHMDDIAKLLNTIYETQVNNIKALPSVTPQEPRKGYISIDDVMSVFDDYMRGEVDAQDTETFLEMLKDKAESEG